MSRPAPLSPKLASLLISMLVAWLSSTRAAAESPLQSQAAQETARPLVMSSSADGRQLELTADYSILSGGNLQQAPVIIHNETRANTTSAAAAVSAGSPAAETTTTTTTTTTTSATSTSTAAVAVASSAPATNPVEVAAAAAAAEARTESATSLQFSTPVSQAPPPPPQPMQQPVCTLGDETYHLGERWNPNLPPFGVQVCVLCECTARQRKSCYEAKVSCRRIINECPLIDSCPDGKKPVIVPGQCCKSCQSTSAASGAGNPQPALTISGSQSPAYESQPQQSPRPAVSTSFSFVYMDERSRDHLALVNNLPACSVAKDGEGASKSPSPVIAASPTTLAPIQTKMAKGIRNDLNGIDSRLAFKSLHDTTSNQLKKSRHSLDSSRPFEGAPRQFENPADQHQHPNDVQSATASNRLEPQQSGQHDSTGSGGVGSRQALASSCKLGNDTFQMGDVWNPILPPNGVQVCVQCHCVFKLRKGRACFETQVTCRRINRDCPVIESCPDGNQPIKVDGQCCKACPTSLESGDEQEQPPASRTNIFQETTMPLNGIMRNEKVYKEFHTQTRNYQLCSRLKGNSGGGGSGGGSNMGKNVRRARRNRRFH